MKEVSDYYFLGVCDKYRNPDEEYLETLKKIRENLGKTIHTKLDIVESFIKLFSISKDNAQKIFKSRTNIKEVDSVLKEIRSITKFPDRLKIICTSDLSPENTWKLLQKLPIEYSKYYYLLGPEKCKSVSYRKSLLDQKLGEETNESTEQELEKTIFEEFYVGRRYTKSYIKEKLREIYTSLGILQTPKASNLSEYFELKRCAIPNPETKKLDEGFEIIKKLL
jgi:hypothetical protein